MNQFNTLLENYLSGKPIYNVIIRILDFLLSASITSFLFKKFYFQYQLLDISDYKSIISFFVDGNYVVPLILFALVHLTLYGISYGLFELTTQLKSNKWLKGIIKMDVTKHDLTDFEKVTVKNPMLNLPEVPDSTWWLGYYNALKSSMKPEQLKHAQEELNKAKSNIRTNFCLFFKMLIALTVYFLSVPHYGYVLFGLSCLVTVGLMSFLWYGYILLEVLPSLLRRLDKIAQEYLAQDVMKNEAVNS